MAQGQAKVWVQVWTAQVPGSVEVEEVLLREVVGLESVKAMVPMLVRVEEKAMDLATLEESVEVLPPMSEYQKMAVEKGWGWVLGLEGHRYKQG